MTLVALMVAGIAVAGVRLGFEDELSPVPGSGLSVCPFTCEPKVNTAAMPASDAQIPDDTPVIGVTSGEYWRAYELDAFYPDAAHVLNDTVAGAPVTVAYCPRTQCARVYSGTVGTGPLSIAVGGWAARLGSESERDGVMVLRVGNANYFQDSGDAVEGDGHFPYAEREFERMTWGEWKHAHPTTDVVTKRQVKRSEPTGSGVGQ